MTQLNPLLSGPIVNSNLVVLALHGLPFPDVDPTLQLAPIRQKLEARLPNVQWLNCCWAEGDNGPYKHAQPLLRLKRGNFCMTYVRRFDEWFRKNMKAIEENEQASNSRISIIAYSSGALIVYSWLADPNWASLEDVSRIEKIFCIAGPYRIRKGRQITLPVNPYIQPPPEPIFVEVNEESIDPKAIRRYLNTNPGKQLVVLLAKKDDTVPMRVGGFPKSTRATQIAQHKIRGADHLTILDHSKTFKHIKDYLNLP